MEIKVKLNETEVLKIIVAHFQPMFPDKVITGNVSSYGGTTLEVTETPEPEKPESEA